MQDRRFSDEELVAYLDGETELVPMAQIEAAVQEDPALAKRLEALRFDVTALQESFELLQPSRDVLGALPVRGRAPAKRPMAAVAMAACVALAVGFGLGNWTSGPERSGWVGYVAAYQALYTHATLDHIQQTPEQLQNELARVSAAVGKDIELAQLTALPDVEYKRGQVLSFQGRPLIQLAFATPSGVPMALCIMRREEAAVSEEALATMRLEGLSSAVWSDGAYDYVLIGGTEDGLVRRLGQALQSMQI
ncbi:hypothetical protein J7413_04465 [Shimia sp. R10_1]|uniref:anti-sigma factor family protein n=1 Tax=Shimia sp. R10_1 TaxID=2821095 RepID=UPI001ADC1E30|nr:hypothetical protein [Shimia sp. R10_1]MBO9472783.1 hypothetical protein [Shimia sp. R10_1]